VVVVPSWARTCTASVTQYSTATSPGASDRSGVGGWQGGDPGQRVVAPQSPAPPASAVDTATPAWSHAVTVLDPARPCRNPRPARGRPQRCRPSPQPLRQQGRTRRAVDAVPNLTARGSPLRRCRSRLNQPCFGPRIWSLASVPATHPKPTLMPTEQNEFHDFNCCQGHDGDARNESRAKSETTR
jgi:hypothetical protein